MLTKNITHPAVNYIEFENKEAHILLNRYNGELNVKLQMYLTMQFLNEAVRKIEYDKLNSEWQNLCKFVNSSNKILNLNPKAFENQIKLIINQIKQNGIHNK